MKLTAFAVYCVRSEKQNENSRRSCERRFARNLGFTSRILILAVEGLRQVISTL